MFPETGEKGGGEGSQTKDSNCGGGSRPCGLPEISPSLSFTCFFFRPLDFLFVHVRPMCHVPVLCVGGTDDQKEGVEKKSKNTGKGHQIDTRQGEDGTRWDVRREEEARQTG